MKKLLAICIVALATPASIALMAPATAAEIKFIGSDIISVSGRIEPGDQLTISSIVLAKMPDSTAIILNSGGGFGNAAFLIGRAIRKRGLATKIPAGARCDSACSLIWLAGVRREIDCQARIGLHAPRFAGTFEPSDSGNKIMANYMAEMGRLDTPDRSGSSDLRRPHAQSCGSGDW
jgi:hypothetical protein